MGLADVAAETSPSADTQFRMGSITKTFTATLVMQCRDEGLLDLATALTASQLERALRAAVAIDPTETGVPSTKGTLT